ncbi:glycosyl transferase [Mycobacterium intermedium]|uniref:Glycosyl transferase n=1 Tax=Mycobacterium intermedium TaxID=28445 RepID=A0A1E3S9Q1_MYCIE|nr:glycosyltransferase family A protein [Mycobacterium intermedium]MCV6962695.1 glycosyltransferase family 2 protein [Mycobacterium intermedium]ODQ98888.1 glycosyl transferase [Mycobacterium intermedium]OPE49532.1 glycosyl transferase [Mycobacterium intermedium]ORB00479.1 glycosyl transferase [Mycobacterium intermedium]
MTPRVSVVVPSYNNVDFIDATMRSILAQSFSDFELVVSDHSSTDGTWEALQQFTSDPRVRLSRLPSGGGAPANFNAVTNLATGEFIKLVCGDDLLFPDSLAEQLAALETHPSAVMAASQRDVVDAAGAPVFRNRGLGRLSGEVSGAVAIRRTILAGTNIYGEPASVLFRRAALVDAGGWDSRFPYLIDQATYCAVLLRGNLVAVPRSLAAFRVSDSQWSVQLVRAQADQAIGFRREFAAAHSDLISPRQLLVGNMRARATAVARRSVYFWLGRRMRSRVATDGRQRGSGKENNCVRISEKS